MSGRQKIQFINAGASRTYQEYTAWLKAEAQKGKAIPKDLFLSLADYSRTIDLFDLHNSRRFSSLGWKWIGTFHCSFNTNSLTSRRSR